MSDYMPTTKQVEDGFAHEPEYEYSNPVGYGAHVQGNRRAFRRWLAEVERAAAEKAWDDAMAEFEWYFESPPVNPYGAAALGLTAGQERENDEG